MPAVSVPASDSAIRADTDRLRSGRNIPVFFILKDDAENFDPEPGDHFNCVRVPADISRGANTLLTTEFEEDPFNWQATTRDENIVQRVESSGMIVDAQPAAMQTALKV